mmetsp:Transcript_121374/g.377345  ORF Transcript_121374/g.377345 Transcript_121374/m.377345 type:complete len:230 (-) Transcript_121374:43-732(-)
MAGVHPASVAAARTATRPATRKAVGFVRLSSSSVMRSACGCNASRGVSPSSRPTSKTKSWQLPPTRPYERKHRKAATAARASRRRSPTTGSKRGVLERQLAASVRHWTLNTGKNAPAPLSTQSSTTTQMSGAPSPLGWNTRERCGARPRASHRAGCHTMSGAQSAGKLSLASSSASHKSWIRYSQASLYGMAKTGALSRLRLPMPLSAEWPSRLRSELPQVREDIAERR